MFQMKDSVDKVNQLNIPTTGSKTACVACSSPIGVLNQIRFNLLAIGESSVEATKVNYHKDTYH